MGDKGTWGRGDVGTLCLRAGYANANDRLRTDKGALCSEGRLRQRLRQAQDGQRDVGTEGQGVAPQFPPPAPLHRSL